MQVNVDVSKIIQELTAYKAQVEESLKRMVVTFAYNVTLSASEHTPIGDEERIEADEGYRKFYFDRMETYGIPMRPGFHKGAWTYSEGSDEVDINSVIYPDAASNVKSYTQRRYKVGDTFYITGVGPGYTYLNSGENWQAPQGIIKPTEDDIVNIYSLNLLNYYKG